MLEKLYNNKRLLLGFALLCYIFIALVCIANGKMDKDEGIWSYIGRIWVENNLPPYIGAVENKTPGIYYINTLSYYLFGTNYFFPRLIGIAFIILNSFILYKIGTLIADKLSGTIAGVLFAFSMLWSAFYSPYLATTEVFMVLFTSIAFLVLFYIRKRNITPSAFLLSGLFLGLAINFKQIAVMGLFGIIVYTATKSDLRWSKKTYAIIAFTAGTVLSLIIGYIPLAFNGVSLHEYFQGAWLILANEGSSFTSSTYLWRIPRFIETFFYSKIVIYYPILIMGLIYRKTLFKNINRVNLLIFWLFFSFIGVNASGYYFDHHLIQMNPSLSLFIGIILSRFSKNTNKDLLIPGFISLLIILPHKPFVQNMSTILDRSFGNDISLMSSFKNHLKGFSDKKELGLWLKKRTDKNDYIFSWQLSVPLSYSNRISPSKYFHSLFISPTKTEEFVLKKLKQNQPEYIIEGYRYRNLKRIEKFIANHYKKITTFKNKWPIYQRKTD